MPVTLDMAFCISTNQPSISICLLSSLLTTVSTILIIYVLYKFQLISFQPHSYYFRCPDDAIRTPTATTNIHNMLQSNAYVLRDDFRYSPKRSMPQKVLTSGSACITPLSNVIVDGKSYDYQYHHCMHTLCIHVLTCIGNKTNLNSICCCISCCFTSHKLKTIPKPTQEPGQKGPASAIPVTQVSLKG